jgi:hypothetical protein
VVDRDLDRIYRQVTDPESVRMAAYGMLELQYRRHR